MSRECTLVWFWCLFATNSALAVMSTTALAHDAPRVHDVLFGPPEQTVLLSNRGLIFGERSSGAFRLLCNDALGINTSEQPNAALLPNGSLIVSTSTGVFRTSDEGCTLEAVAPFEGVNAPALAQDPADPTKVYVATFGAGVGGIHASSDSGDTFTLVHAAADDEFYRELLIAPSDGRVIYASALLFGPMVSSHFVERSTDGAETFERFVVPLEENEASLTLLAVSPDDDRMLLARALDNDIATRMDRLLVSHDGGETFESPIRLREIADAGFADGAVWVAGATGVFRSTDGALSFEQVEGAQLMSCVDDDDDEPLLCGRYAPNENGIATFDPDSRQLNSWFDFTDVTSPVSCDPGSETAQTCAPLWHDWSVEILIATDASVSNSDAGNASFDAGTIPNADGGQPTDSKSSGCNVTGVNPWAPSSMRATLALALMGLVLWARRHGRSARVIAR